jgi:hypothetical protein
MFKYNSSIKIYLLLIFIDRIVENSVSEKRQQRNGLSGWLKKNLADVFKLRLYLPTFPIVQTLRRITVN